MLVSSAPPAWPGKSTAAELTGVAAEARGAARYPGQGRVTGAAWRQRERADTQQKGNLKIVET